MSTTEELVGIININRSFEPDLLVRSKNQLTGDLELTKGLTGVQFRWALTPTGTAIATTQVDGAERNPGNTARYYTYGYPPSVLAALLPYVGLSVYLILSHATDLNCAYREYVVALSDAVVAV